MKYDTLLSGMVLYYWGRIQGFKDSRGQGLKDRVLVSFKLTH
jgi:hypothetical protein